MMCSDGLNLLDDVDPDDVDPDNVGTCDECGCVTVRGEAAEGCNYSPVLCSKCGAAPCDGSC